MSMPIDYRARIRQALINNQMGEYGADHLLEGFIRQIRDGYPDEAAAYQQAADAQAALDRVQAKVADWREWNPKDMSWAIRDVENAIANTPPPEPQDPATLDTPSATGAPEQLRRLPVNELHALLRQAARMDPQWVRGLIEDESLTGSGDQLGRELATMKPVARVDGRAHRIAYQASVEAHAAVARIGQMASAWEQQLSPVIRTATVVDAIRTVTEGLMTPAGEPETDAALAEWRTAAESALKEVEQQTARADDAEVALALLHEGEEPHTDEAVVPTPAQWIWLWNRATPAGRLASAAQIQDLWERADRWVMGDHEARLAQQRAAGHAAQADAIDRTDHANLNRHHMRPTGDGSTA